jgi:hypothetical protein
MLAEPCSGEFEPCSDELSVSVRKAGATRLPPDAATTPPTTTIPISANAPIISNILDIHNQICFVSNNIFAHVQE